MCVHACWVTLVVSYSLQPCGLSPLSMGFSRQEYWSGLPFPSPRDLPNLGIKSASLCLLPWQADSFINSATWETINPYSLPIRKIMLSLSFLFVLIFKKAFYFVLKWIEVKVTQLCLTLCNPMDCTVHGILQARILEWVAIPFSRGSSQPRDWTQVSHTAGGFFTSWAT